MAPASAPALQSRRGRNTTVKGAQEGCQCSRIVMFVPCIQGGRPATVCEARWDDGIAERADSRRCSHLALHAAPAHRNPSHERGAGEAVAAEETPWRRGCQLLASVRQQQARHHPLYGELRGHADLSSN
eukprot:scaffold9655_cov123-Isochrysis_galbana.AAC.2